MELTLKENFVLIAFDPETGRNRASNFFGYGLAGAILMELAELKKVKIENKRVVITDSHRTGDIFLDEAMTVISDSPRPIKVKSFLGKIQRKTKKFKKPLIQALVEKRYLREHRKRFLFIPYRLFPSANISYNKDLVESIRKLVLRGVDADGQIVMLAGLAGACKFSNKFFRSKEDQSPDAITFAGNGEPTIHPGFADIISDTIGLRDQYFPEANITVLSNASMLHRKDVFQALKSVDNNIQKIDAGSEGMFQIINQPSGNLSLEKVVEQLRNFGGNLIIQTLFLRGKHNGSTVDNTSDEEIERWITLLKKVNPKYVMIYPIDRATPEQDLEKISFEELSEIAGKVNGEGINTKVFG